MPSPPRNIDLAEVLNEKHVGHDYVASAVFSFHDWCREYRQRFEDPWVQDFENASVVPYLSGSYVANTSNPLGFVKGFGQRSASTGSRALKTPESWQVMRILMAILMSALFGGNNIVIAKPRGREDIDKADSVTALIESTLRQPGNWNAIYMGLKDCIVAGAGWVKVPYVREFRRGGLVRQVARDAQGQALLDENGRPVTTFRRADRIIRDDPAIFYRDLLDVWIDPGAQDDRTALGTVEVDIITERQALEMFGDTPQVREAIATGSAKYMREVNPNFKKEIHGIDNDITLPYDRYIPLEMFTFQGEAFWDPINPENTSDRVPHRQVRVLNGFTVQNDPYPWVELDGRGTDLALIRTDLLGGVLYPPSVLTATRYLQDVQDQTLLLWIEALTRGMHNIQLVGSGAQDPTLINRLRTAKSGDFVSVMGSPDAVKPLQYENTAFRNGVGIMEATSNWIKNAGGAMDPVQGIQAKSGTTATEVQQLATSSLSLSQLMAAVMENGFLPALVTMIFSRHHQFISDSGKLLQRVGEKTGYKALSFFNIDGMFDFEWRPSRTELTRPQRAETNLRLASILQQFPQMAAVFNVQEFALQLAEDLGNPSAARFILNDPKMIAANVEQMRVANEAATPRPSPGNAPAQAPQEMAAQTATAV